MYLSKRWGLDDLAAVQWPCWIPHLSQEFTLLLLDSGLIPHCDLEHAFPEVPSVNVGVDEGLVPLGLGALLDCLSPPFTFITATKITTHRTKLIEFPVGFLKNINSSIRQKLNVQGWVGASLICQDFGFFVAGRPSTNTIILHQSIIVAYECP